MKKTNLNKGERNDIVEFFNQNKKIAVPQDEKTSITIQNSNILHIQNGRCIESRKLDIAKIVEEISNINYKYNCFNSSDVKYSPLEADRNENFWVKKYHRIDFPKFMPIVLGHLLKVGTLPTYLDVVFIYMQLYMECVPDEELLQGRQSTMLHDYQDRTNVGKTMVYTDGTRIQNKVVRFKKQYANNTYPFNEFTTEMIFNRAFKAYASFLRDIVLPLKMANNEYIHHRNTDVIYDLYGDVCKGIDTVFNDVVILSSTSTPSAIKFDSRKAEDETCRHENIKEYKYVVRTKARVLGKKGIFVPPDNFVEDFAENLIAHKYFKNTERSIPTVYYG